MSTKCKRHPAEGGAAGNSELLTEDSQHQIIRPQAEGKTGELKRAKAHAFAPFNWQPNTPARIAAPLSWAGAPMAIAARAIRKDVASLMIERRLRSELVRQLDSYAEEQLRRVGAISAMIGPLRKSAQQLEWHATLKPFGGLAS